MKTIKVILPVNNPSMLSMDDLAHYQSKHCRFILEYPNTELTQLNCTEDLAAVWPRLLDMIEKTKKESIDALIMYAFGDCAVKEAQQALCIPVLGLGRVVIPVASALCQKKFSVIPSHLEHNEGFIEALVASLNMQHNFVASERAINVEPQDAKTCPNVLTRLIEAASHMIEKHEVDAFTIGCGSFIGYAKPLQAALRKKYSQSILVIDPFSVPLAVASSI